MISVAEVKQAVSTPSMLTPPFSMNLLLKSQCKLYLREKPQHVDHNVEDELECKTLVFDMQSKTQEVELGKEDYAQPAVMIANFHHQLLSFNFLVNNCYITMCSGHGGDCVIAFLSITLGLQQDGFNLATVEGVKGDEWGASGKV